jgi:hypothetical protein
MVQEEDTLYYISRKGLEFHPLSSGKRLRKNSGASWPWRVAGRDASALIAAILSGCDEAIKEIKNGGKKNG